MAKARAILKRRKAVQNIRKITRTMQLIATARFQKAFSKTLSAKPYTDKIRDLVSNIARYAQVDHPLLRNPEKQKRIALLVVTSNRGLAGGYNSSILQKAYQFVLDKKNESCEAVIDVVGKKGISYLKFLGWKIDNEFRLPDEPSYMQVVEIADHYIKEFSSGGLDGVYIAYMQFHSASKQSATVASLLPLRIEARETVSPVKWNFEYDFLPSPGEMMIQLLPEAVKVSLFQCFREAAVSEHVARMVAMKAATDNAEEMIKHFGRQANKARQSQITSELSELIGGAEALG
jgi:F-type H+-transporting ATPase subunit gamma